MSVDSAVPLAPAGEELVEITSGGKTYLVPKALADEVLRRRRLKRPGLPAPPRRRERRSGSGSVGVVAARAARRVRVPRGLSTSVPAAAVYG